LIDFQLNYIEFDHQYFTETARNIREYGKRARIQELKIERNRLLQEGNDENQIN
jgi:hypothetical protein